jgi:hypothetical protein
MRVKNTSFDIEVWVTSSWTPNFCDFVHPRALNPAPTAEPPICPPRPKRCDGAT